MADNKITNREELEAWLADKPREWAQVIAMRSALRVLPLAGEELHREGGNETKLDFALTVFRANFISWCAREYPHHEMRKSVLAAADAADADAADAADARAALAALAAAYAAYTAAAATTRAAAQAAQATRAAAEAARAAADAVWQALAADAAWLESAYDNAVASTRALAGKALWQSSPVWVASAWENLQAALRHRDPDWRAFCRWYDGRLRGRRHGFPVDSSASAALDIRIATQPDEWWKRGAAAVNSDIAEWVGEARGRLAARDKGPLETAVTEFIVMYLEEVGRPSSRAEILEALAQSKRDFDERRLTQMLRALSERKEIRRVGAGLYEAGTIAFHQTIDLGITKQDDAAKRSEKPNVSSFIVRFLAGREGSSTIKELRAALAGANYDIKDKTIIDQLSRLVRAGKIRRVSTGVYEAVKSSQTDFFISYSIKDEALAKRIGAILEGEGFTAFAQFKDIPVGSNFINEMKRGLQNSSRLIAVLSPDYEASKHCQSEWNAAYHEDPDGSRRKLIGFLTRETELNKLAKQFVYKDLIGLGDDAFRSAVVEAIRAAMAGAPPPAARSKTPFDYGWTKTGKMTVLGDGMDHVSVPLNRSPADAKKRLEAAKALARELADDYRDGRLKNCFVRPEFIRHLDRYAEKIPSETDGNIYLSDSEARSLRTLFENDVKSGLDDGFAARMRTLLEHHQGVRPYFPDLNTFYQDVRTGQLSEPLPLDAMAKAERVVAAHTPHVFMPDVSGSLAQVEQAKPEAPEASEAESNEAAPTLTSMTLPPDPIADIDPERAAQQAKAGALNRIWKVLLRVEKGAKGIERVEKAISDYGKVIGPIVKWLFEHGG